MLCPARIKAHLQHRFARNPVPHRAAGARAASRPRKRSSRRNSARRNEFLFPIVGCLGDASCRGWRHCGNFEAQSVDQALHLFADVARAATISASASVPADMRRSPSVSRTDMQASASGSFSRIAISAEVSTTITSAVHPHHRGNPGCARHLARRRLGGGRRSDLVQQGAAGFPVRHPLEGDQSHDGMAMAGQDDLIPRLRAANQLGQLAFGFRNRHLHQPLT